MSNSQQQTLEIGFEAFLQELPAEYRPLAYDFKVFTRGRKFKSPADVMRAVMDYCGLDFSLREVAGHFSLLEERVSDTAVHKRLRACLPWVKALLERMFGSCSEGLIAGGLRFVVVDGSTVQVPGAQGTSYRLHIAIDLVKLEILHVEVTDAHEGESLERYPLKEGDVVIVDRGYNQPAALINQAAQGVCVVVRYNPHGMNLYDEQMQKVDWERVLKAADGQPVCISVRVPKDGEFIEAHVHATPLPQEQAAGARRRARAAAKKKGRTAKARTLFLAGWVLIFSGVPPEILNTETIAELYRVRWQVELVIKRLKSILDIDRIRAREGGLLAQLYLHGKLLYATVVEKLVRKRFGTQGTGLDGDRLQTPWRLWTLVAQEVKAWIATVDVWDERRIADSLQAMRERPRRRSLQTLPQQAHKLILFCRGRGLSNV